MPKVSIIVPVYNVEDYLAECLDALSEQTLKDIEIICVNDGSTDSSGDILEEYAKKDSRIKIIHQQNQGQGMARNNALQKVTGEYLGFVDPDDWVSPTMFETLYDTAKRYDCDLVEESFTLHNEQRKYVKIVGNHSCFPHNKVFTRCDTKNYIFSNKLAVWNKIYKTEFIRRNNIQFMDIPRSEDIVFTVKSRALASRIKYIDKPDYQYRIKENNQVIVSDSKKADLLTSFDFLIKLKQELINSDIYNLIEEDYGNWALEKLYEQYRELKAENKSEFVQKIAENFDNNFCKRFQSKIFLKTILDTIFSVRNINYDGQKCKVFKILGIEIKTKYIKK